MLRWFMEKEKDMGLRYLMELGIRPARDKKGMYTQLKKQLGQREADRLMEQVWQESDVQRLYDVKNESYEKGITFSGAYDGDIYRKACNWIARNQDVFGETILDVGCDCGIMSCFLAKLLPGSHITAIDRTENAVKVARQLAETLQLHNISFVHADLAALGEQTYDTVFSMRTVHENVTNRDIQPSFAPLLEQAQLYGNAVADYGQQLAGKVKADGTLVSIERGEKNPMFLGWLFDLHENGLALHWQRYAELCCTAVGKQAVLQAVTAVKKDAEADNVYAFWCSLFPVAADSWLFTGWEGETVLQNLLPQLGAMLSGYQFYTKDGDICGKYAVWKFENRGDAIVYYQGSTEKTTVGIYAASLLPEIQRQIKQLCDTCQKQGLIVQKIMD